MPKENMILLMISSEHEDFNNSDHYIKGHFDENGLFTGIVRVFKETFNYTYRPVRSPGKTHTDHLM